MRSLVIYYSYTGKTKALAESAAASMGADLCQVRDQKRPGVFKAYTLGCLRAMRGKRTPIEPLEVSLEEYDEIHIMAPVWAGQAAPPILNVLDVLPPGKSVSLCMVAMSGQCKAKDPLLARLKAVGYNGEEVAFEVKKA